ncbi:hypothetical protein GGE45_003098 [Rhizobium aethiopicum]|uniref:Uncharacterized protein n=1 Tax=Rhizobium aethiopicum TaxID=1138170 RepID=A0A7W6QAC9_9HYPH|nr:hypothetical protein [Rhizobium aethiopicum]MBB4193325.1 hypothetical protein [Rhizobium aethiopicum]MBB4580759.1 hypothetical protein [Rhizobium aethiopicum]
MVAFLQKKEAGRGLGVSRKILEYQSRLTVIAVPAKIPILGVTDGDEKPGAAAAR